MLVALGMTALETAGLPHAASSKAFDPAATFTRRPSGRLAAFLLTTASALAFAAAAQAQCVTPTTPYTNSAAIECIALGDGAHHSGNVTNASGGNITSSTDSGIQVGSGTTLDGSIVNNGTITISTGSLLKGIIVATGTVTGSIVNTGNVTAPSIPIEVLNGDVGSISNSGNLSPSSDDIAGLAVVALGNNPDASQNESVIDGGIVNTSTGDIQGGIFDRTAASPEGMLSELTLINGGILNDGNIAGTLYGIGADRQHGKSRPRPHDRSTAASPTMGSSAAARWGSVSLVGQAPAAFLTNGDLLSEVVGLNVADASVVGDIKNTGEIESDTGDAIEVNAGTLTQLEGTGPGGAPGSTGTVTFSTTIKGSIENSGTLIIPQGQVGIDVIGSGAVTVTVTGNIVNSGVVGGLTGGTNSVGIQLGPNTLIEGGIANSGNLLTAFGVIVDAGHVDGAIVNSGSVESGGGGIGIASVIAWWRRHRRRHQQFRQPRRRR